jgi:copper chaperone CopZ
MTASQMGGVKSAEVSYEGKTGVFEIDPAKVGKEQIVAAITELGYTAT